MAKAKSVTRSSKLGPAERELALSALRTKELDILVVGGGIVGTGSALARATDAPGGGFHWGAEAHHLELPRGNRVQVEPLAPLAEILNGPSSVADGRVNLMGALRRSMATTGYSDLKEFQRVEVVVAPYQQS